jgi:predicted AlkP superfamily pyrophosphatase or phosphodiesterase
MPEAKIVSCSEWNAINGLLTDEDRVDANTAPNSAALMDIISEKVKEHPTLLFIQVEDPDSAGHAGEYGSEDYLRAIRRDDSYVGQVYDAYRREGLLDDTLFLVITDHGGIRNGHGGYTDEEKYITLGAYGHSVPKGKIGDACTRDLSAIVLYALGIDIPA